MRTLLVLVEGQTEEIFVRDVLGPHLAAHHVETTSVLLKTKRVKAGGHFRGGVTGTSQVVKDLRRLLGHTGATAVSTLIDYYGLPGDFPGMADRPSIADPYRRVRHVEAKLEEIIDDKRFIPHLTLHEYEAWIFSEPGACTRTFSDPQVLRALEAIRDRYHGAERINENTDTCPSRQLRRVYPSYEKTSHGPLAVAEIGLPRLRVACPHLADWLTRLEALESSAPGI